VGTQGQSRYLSLSPSPSCQDSLDPPQGYRPLSHPQRWHRLAVEVPHEAAEAVANFLLELGSQGVAESIIDVSRPETARTEVQGFFSIDRSAEALCEALSYYVRDLAALIPAVDQALPRVVEITSEAWRECGREHFPPLEVGHRFLVLPPWVARPADSTRIVIVIDPSMAFGTGHHATTQGCLHAIEQLWDRGCSAARALDIGTGSGILTIALAKLGAHVWATDTDPVALDEARKNLDTNKVMPRVHLSDSAIEQLPAPFPLVVANLFATTLIALSPMLSTVVKTQGYAILSGIQSEQEKEVRAAYPPPLWHLSTRLSREEWVTLVLQRT
jgi:ribosomal protein L11 methyltransferase